MDEKDVKLTEQEITEFYQRFGGDKFSLQGQVAREYGGRKIEIYFKSVGFASTVVSTIGIVAGFGFTALSSVESKMLFFLGESLLLYGILHGLLWIQNIYNAEFGALDRAQVKQRTYFTSYNNLFMQVWDRLSKEKIIDKDSFSELVKKSKEALDVFAPTEGESTKGFERNIFSKRLYYSMIAGSIFLISSFFVVDLANFLLKIICT